MAFKTPTFNVWAQVLRYQQGPSAYRVYGYSLCQLRGPDSHWEGPGPGTAGLQFEVLFPKLSDIGDLQMLSQSTWTDLVCLAGWGTRVAEVNGVCMKGGGFNNEYVLCLCSWEGANSYPGLGAVNRSFPQLNTTLVPPGGYTPLPLRTASTTWSGFPT